MLPTPDTSHIDVARIYEPAEDSFLFLDTLSSASEVAFLKDRFSGISPLIIEVGTGSGVILAFLAANAVTIFGRDEVLALGIDVNRCACQAAAGTVGKAVSQPSNVSLDVFQADLLSSLRHATADVLVFNPPYVPTPSVPGFHSPWNAEEDSFIEESRLLELSYAGGNDGMEVTRRFLAQLPDYLSPTGVAYLLLCAQNKPLQVIDDIEHTGIFQASVVGRSGKTSGWEKLCIVRITRRTLE